jgi:hypothetical protein
MGGGLVGAGFTPAQIAGSPIIGVKIDADIDADHDADFLFGNGNPKCPPTGGQNGVKKQTGALMRPGLF